MNVTSDVIVELAKRAVACKGWRWMPGMKAVGRRNVPTAWFRVEEHTTSLLGEWKDALPDFRDPATFGCLLALVREYFGDTAAAVIDVGGWRMRDCYRVPNRRMTLGLPVWEQPSEIAALIAALEAAND